MKFIFSLHLQEFEYEVLESHNKYRRIHDAPPLQLCEDLIKISQDWANELAEIDELKHSENGYGECIYCFDISDPNNSNNLSMCVDAWYNDISLGPSNFEQIIWKYTKRLGIATACNSNTCYVVATYWPPVNLNSMSSENLDIQEPVEIAGIMRTHEVMENGINSEAADYPVQKSFWEIIATLFCTSKQNQD